MRWWRGCCFPTKTPLNRNLSNNHNSNYLINMLLRDKTLLSDYALFAYNMGEKVEAFCFFELSKSASLRDVIFVESINYQEIKGYM